MCQVCGSWGGHRTSRTFGERYKEHLKAPSAIHHHSTLTGHTTNHNNFQIIGREGHNLARNIKESIYIRVNNPSLNNNIGKFNLSHIWDRVLLNRWENVHFSTKPSHVTPQIDCLGKTSPVLRVSTHIYGVSKEIDGKMFIFRVNLGM